MAFPGYVFGTLKWHGSLGLSSQAQHCGREQVTWQGKEDVSVIRFEGVSVTLTPAVSPQPVPALYHTYHLISFPFLYSSKSCRHNFGFLFFI